MNPDLSWARYFNLPAFTRVDRVPRPSLHEMLLPRCAVCGETCGDLLG